VGAGVGNFFPPLRVGAGVGLVDGLGVALGDTVAEGAGLGDGEGLAVGVGEGLGALSTLLALNRSAQKHPRTRRGKIPLFICQSCREERRITAIPEKSVNRNFQNYLRKLFTVILLRKQKNQLNAACR
jgi:hypothetical protein